MLQNLTGWHALVILAIVLLVFGTAKLPALAMSLGQSIRILKKETAGDDAGAAPAGAPSAPVAVVAPAADLADVATEPLATVPAESRAS